MLHSDFFENLNFNALSPRAGRILISEPFMQDLNFSRSVVLLVDHNEDGSVGFVLNRMADLNVEEVLVNEESINAPLYLGGPVGVQQLFYIHTLNEELVPGAVQIMDGLYWGGDFNQLVFYFNNGMLKKNQIRFFAGYSGWAPGQLENELKEHAWIVSKFTAELALKDSEDFWKEMLTKLGDKFKVMRDFPENPQLN